MLDAEYGDCAPPTGKATNLHLLGGGDVVKW